MHGNVIKSELGAGEGSAWRVVSLRHGVKMLGEPGASQDWGGARGREARGICIK